MADSYVPAELEATIVVLRKKLADAEAERDQLRALADAVRVMWDNIVATEDDAIIGFPINDYNAIEEALDALDESEATDG